MAGVNARARMRGIERVADKHWHLFTQRRCHGLRVNHFGTKVSQFKCFLIAHLRQHLCLWHQPRICTQNAIDIGPDVQFSGVKKSGKD
jgi:hypothetical protein